jgi:Flp pilus assembly pilin Flp
MGWGDAKACIPRESSIGVGQQLGWLDGAWARVPAGHADRRSLMIDKLRAFLSDESGAETVEVVLITLVLLTPAVFLFKELYAKVMLLMVSILRQLQP